MTDKENSFEKDINVPCKEPIMVDGVDVSGCKGFYIHDRSTTNIDYWMYGQCKSSKEYGCYCRNNPNCYYKQLARKTQECEELKERLERIEEDLKYQCVDCMNVKSDRYRKALEEIEEYINQYEMLGKLNIKYILNIINKAKGEGKCYLLKKH